MSWRLLLAATLLAASLPLPTAQANDPVPSCDTNDCGPLICDGRPAVLDPGGCSIFIFIVRTVCNILTGSPYEWCFVAELKHCAMFPFDCVREVLEGNGPWKDAAPGLYAALRDAALPSSASLLP